MATSELAAILARRRAKDGSPAVHASPDCGESVSEAMSSNTGKKSVELPSYLASNTLKTANISTHTDSSTIPSPMKEQEARITTPSLQKSSRDGAKVQQLKQNLAGIGLNPFRPGAPPPRKFGGGESIMTTGEEYARTHAMGIAMPGMGSAIPMPGLAKMGVRLPGFAHGSSESTEEVEAARGTIDDMSHDTLTRAVGPKRRAPTTRTAVPTTFPNIDNASSDIEAAHQCSNAETNEFVEGYVSPDAMTRQSASEAEDRTQLDESSQKSNAFESRECAQSTVPVSKLGDENAEMSPSSLFCHEVSNLPTVSEPEQFIEPAQAELLPITTPSDHNMHTLVVPTVQSPKEVVPAALRDQSSDSDWSEDEDEEASSLFGYSNMEPKNEDNKPSSPHPLSPSFSPGSTGNAASLFGNDIPQSPVCTPSISKVDEIEGLEESAGSERSSSISIEAKSTETQNGLKICSAAYICNPPNPIFGLDYIDEESGDESDDEEGLFGTGFPTLS